MKSSVLLIAILATAACSKKDKNEAPAAGAKPTTPAAGAPATPSGTPAAPAAGALDCDKVLPKDLREKHFKKHKLVSVESGLPTIGKCNVEPIENKPDGTPQTGEVNAHCEKNIASAKAPTIDHLKKTFKEMKPIDGVPESLAWQTEGGWQFNAWDADSDCMVNGILPGGVDGPALIRDWLAVLPPK